jgi:hypothetical protein
MRNLKNGGFRLFGPGEIAYFLRAIAIPARSAAGPAGRRSIGFHGWPRRKPERPRMGDLRMPEIAAVLVKKTLSDCWLAETGQGDSRRAEELGRNCC